MTSEVEYTCNNCGHEGHNTRAAPDAPELVTVGYQYEWHIEKGQWRQYPPLFTENYNTRELVERSQAAAIIAAERAENERLKHLIDGDDCPDPDKIDALFRRAEAAEAKNKELEDAWLNAEGKISDLEAEMVTSVRLPGAS